MQVLARRGDAVRERSQGTRPFESAASPTSADAPTFVRRRVLSSRIQQPTAAGPQSSDIKNRWPLEAAWVAVGQRIRPPKRAPAHQHQPVSVASQHCTRGFVISTLRGLYPLGKSTEAATPPDQKPFRESHRSSQEQGPGSRTRHVGKNHIEEVHAQALGWGGK